MSDIASKLEHAYCTAGLPPENPIRLAAARLRELEAENAAALALLREAMAYIDDDERPVPAGLELSDRIYALLAKEGA